MSRSPEEFSPDILITEETSTPTRTFEWIEVSPNFISVIPEELRFDSDIRSSHDLPASPIKFPNIFNDTDG